MRIALWILCAFLPRAARVSVAIVTNQLPRPPSEDMAAQIAAW
jgi:hypothetical protein